MIGVAEAIVAALALVGLVVSTLLFVDVTGPRPPGGP